jgi:acyl carrier protein
MNIQNKVIELLKHELQNELIDENSSMDNVIGWDSQFQLVLIMAVEDEFDIMIPNDKLHKLISVSDIVDLIIELKS